MRLDVEELNKRFSVINSASLYDVLDSMGYPNQCLDLGIKPFRKDMRIAGPAFTMVGTRDPLYSKDFINPEIDDFALFDHIYPGCVVVINAEQDRVVGHWGEMMSYGARNRGATGVVIDGGTRDQEGILKISNWSCFARYSTPIEADKRWRLQRIQVPICMSGTLTAQVKVNPGDWLVGDLDGVIVIPQEILYDVLIAVEDVEQREELTRIELDAGASLHDVFAKYQRA